MKGDIITPKDLELSAMRAWKERAIEAERKLLDYEGKEMLYSGRTELAAFRKREPFVQEVIRHATDFAALSKVAVDIPFSEHTKRTVARIEARSALLEAVRKLAEWSPT